MDKRAKSILIGSGAAAVGVAAVSAVSQTITSYLMKVALDRELPNVKNLPKARMQLSGCTNLEAFLKLRSRAGERLEQCSSEVVQIESYDGERLVGHWCSCAEPERIILAMHGWRSSWSSDFGLISDFWHTNHCSVLYAEQRGQNNSGGASMGFGLLERFDCREWLKWVDEHNERDLPIYLAGVSMGAATVLMASGLSLPGNICGIIADCAFTSPEAIWKHVAQNNLHLSYGLRSMAVNEICKKRLQIGAGEYSTLEALKLSEIPVLFIHGTDDHFVPVEMTYENYKVCTAPKRLFVVPGADHGMSYVVDQLGYQSAMMDFWSFCERNKTPG